MEPWWKNAVIYQIYPRSFKDTNGDGVGDIAGIIEKLDYLNDGTEGSLGVDAIWLSPVYKSPMKDFGYDVSDYYDIDPIFGTMDEFARLVSGAHRRGIKIILDYIPNHTSDQHLWFAESRSSRDSPKRSWYIWRDPKEDGRPPNNWLSVFGGPAWTFDEKTGQYYLHSFLSEQPDLNWRNPEVVAELQKVLEFWMQRGVDGFRTDALYHLIKDDQFRDEPTNPNFREGKDNPYEKLLHVYTRGQEELASSINKLCTVLGEYRGRFMVGEMHTLPTEELVRFQKVCVNQLHLPFNFNLIELGWNAKTYRQFIDDYDRKLGQENTPNWVLGNHDQARIASRIGTDAARLAAMLILTMRGTPFVYYGEELGMQNSPIKPSQVQDPWDKNVPGLGFGRDPERTPMQWGESEFAGFSDATPWLPVHPHYKDINVKVASSNPKSMLNLYKRLIWFRKGSAALLEGSYKSIDVDNDEVFCYLREKNGERCLVALNFSASNQKVVPGIEEKESGLVMSTYLDQKEGRGINLNELNLRPNEGVLMKLAG